jgi:hypothetical protein
VRLGRHVRIAESEIEEFVEAGTCSQSLGPRCHDLAQASFREHPAS